MISPWGNMELGELIEALKKFDGSAQVVFDFCGMAPVNVDSYRGFYDHLAISYSEYHVITVAELLDKLEKAVGATFHGYKGGAYVMGRDTPMWVDNIGESTSTGVMRVDQEEYGAVVIRTAKLNV